MKNKSMKISFANNQYYLTRISSSDIYEIKQYCKKHNLEIVDCISDSLHGYTVWAEKPNQRIRILRKAVHEIEGWKLIEDIPTSKMHWLIYEKCTNK